MYAVRRRGGRTCHQRTMAIRYESQVAPEEELGVPPILTPREALVLELVAEGLSTRRIAAILFVSEQAVTYHVSNLLSKFGCENRAGVVARAFVFGYLDPYAWPPRLATARIPQTASGRA